MERKLQWNDDDTPSEGNEVDPTAHILDKSSIVVPECGHV